MSDRVFKSYSAWLSQVTAAIAVITLIHIKSKFIFASGNTAGTLLMISMAAAVFTLILGIITLPRWQGLAALAIFAYMTYEILFTQIYAVS